MRHILSNCQCIISPRAPWGWELTAFQPSIYLLSNCIYTSRRLLLQYLQWMNTYVLVGWAFPANPPLLWGAFSPGAFQAVFGSSCPQGTGVSSECIRGGHCDSLGHSGSVTLPRWYSYINHFASVLHKHSEFFPKQAQNGLQNISYSLSPYIVVELLNQSPSKPRYSILCI